MKFETLLQLVLLLFLFSCNKENNPTFYSLSVTVVPEDAGYIPIFSDTLLEKNTPVEIKAVPKEGFAFLNWEGDISSTDNPLSFTITEDIELVAIFLKKTYSLTTNIEGKGRVTETIVRSKTDYEHGTVVQLEAIPDSTWVFRKWGGDVTESDNIIKVTITSPINIEAIFEEGIVDYCLPIKLDGFAHQSNGDSVHFMDYDFKYDGQFLSSYTKIYNYRRETIENINGMFKTIYTYENDLIHKIIEGHYLNNGKLWAEYEYTFNFSNDQLASLDYEYFVGDQTGKLESTRIEYEEPCGLRFFEAEGTDAGMSTSYKSEYIYSDNCLTYKVDGDVVQTFERQYSIFKDALGLVGFIGSSYANMFSRFDPTPLYNKNNLRLSEVRRNYINPENVQHETLTEKYSYESFIVNQDYPRYFSRIITDSKDGTKSRDTFTLEYACRYK